MIAFLLGASVAANIALLFAVLYLRKEMLGLREDKEQKSVYEEIMSLDLGSLEEDAKSSRYPGYPPADEGACNMLVAAAGKRERGIRRSTIPPPKS